MVRSHRTRLVAMCCLVLGCNSPSHITDSQATHSQGPELPPNADKWTRVGNFVLLDGGVLGRADDMLVIRGVNIFPSSVEAILRGFPEIREFRLIAHRDGALDALTVEIEDDRAEPARVGQELQLRLGLKIDVRCVEADSLPRFEGKAKRFLDQR